MSLKPTWVLLLVLVFFTGTTSTGNVLVWHTAFSHWLNMKAIRDELTARGHQVTVLVPSTFQASQFHEPLPFQVEMISVPISKEEVETFIQDFLYMWSYEMHELFFWGFFIKLYDIMEKIMSTTKLFCDAVLLNEKLLEKFRSAGFDILISDPCVVCGELLAEKLHLPFIYSFRFSSGNTLERFCGGMPSPPSYVPASLGGLTDRMSFVERMRNMLFYFSQDIVFHQVILKDWDKYYSDILGLIQPATKPNQPNKERKTKSHLLGNCSSLIPKIRSSRSPALAQIVQVSCDDWETDCTGALHKQSKLQHISPCNHSPSHWGRSCHAFTPPLLSLDI